MSFLLLNLNYIGAIIHWPIMANESDHAAAGRRNHVYDMCLLNR